MALDARLDGLSEKHRKLETLIEKEMAHPAADTLKLTAWKRQKLRIKDEMHRLRAHDSSAHPHR